VQASLPKGFTNLGRDWFNATDSKVGSSRILSERVLLVGDVQVLLKRMKSEWTIVVQVTLHPFHLLGG